MESQTEKIKCPNCGTNIDVNDILYHQLEEELKTKFNSEIAIQKKELKKREDALSFEQEKLKNLQESTQAEIDAAVKAKLQKETEKIKIEAKTAAEEAQSERISDLESELKEKSEQVKELNRSKGEIERLKREKNEQKDLIEAENEKKFSEMLKKEKKRIQKESDDKNELKVVEKENLIEQLKKQLQEAQRKAEQGSSQSQGETQELAIESWLQDFFPLDTIEEIKKGAQGADCLQIVNTRSQTNCGKIYYESKRTKSFQTTWLEKFKADLRKKKADIGVLVTEAMPSDMDRMGQKEGIWICTFDEFKGLSAVLRETIIRIHNATSSQENKGSKMEMLYDFLTGIEFRQQIEAIVEGFTQMQSDIDAEKRAFQAQWKKREKQIEKVLLNTTNMYSSIKGIAGTAIQPVKLLELPMEEEIEF